MPPRNIFSPEFQFDDSRRTSRLERSSNDPTDIRLITMDSETPFEGTGADNGDDPAYRWLDEWLCEYVDGTMDPSLETVFEQYVRANPELKAHVQRLQETRKLLCNCSLPKTPSDELETDVCQEVARDESPSSTRPEPTGERDIRGLGFVSSVAAALLIGFLAGTMVADSGPAVPSATPTSDRASVEPEQKSVSVRPTQTTAPNRSTLRPPGAPLPLTPSDSGHSPSTITTVGTR